MSALLSSIVCGTLMAFSISVISLILESFCNICFTCNILLQLPSQLLTAIIRINTPTPANTEMPMVKKSKTKEMITCNGADQTSWLFCKKSFIHCASTDIRLTISPTVVVCRALLLRRRAYNKYRLYHEVEVSTWFTHQGPEARGCVNRIGTDTEWYNRLVPWAM